MIINHDKKRSLVFMSEWKRKIIFLKERKKNTESTKRFLCVCENMIEMKSRKKN